MRRHEFATLRWAGGAERREGRTRARDFFHKSQAFQSPSRWRSNLLSRLRCCGKVAGVAEIAFEITEKWKSDARIRTRDMAHMLTRRCGPLRHVLDL